jgi:hypothetical protein
LLARTFFLNIPFYNQCYLSILTWHRYKTNKQRIQFDKGCLLFHCFNGSFYNIHSLRMHLLLLVQFGFICLFLPLFKVTLKPLTTEILSFFFYLFILGIIGTLSIRIWIQSRLSFAVFNVFWTRTFKCISMSMWPKNSITMFINVLIITFIYILYIEVWIEEPTFCMKLKLPPVHVNALDRRKARDSEGSLPRMSSMSSKKAKSFLSFPACKRIYPY